MRRAKLGSRCEGIAIIEFTICVPVLLLLLFATAEVGRMLFQYNTLTKSVRDGARFAVTGAAVAGGSTRIVNLTPAVRDQTRNLVVTGTANASSAALLPGFTTQGVSVTSDTNGFITVSATYTFAPVFTGVLPTFGLGDSLSLAVPLTATVVMRAL